MDPRRKLDEKHERLRASQVPFIETYREMVLEEQPLGKPLEREHASRARPVVCLAGVMFAKLN